MVVRYADNVDENFRNSDFIRSIAAKFEQISCPPGTDAHILISHTDNGSADVLSLQCIGPSGSRFPGTPEIGEVQLTETASCCAASDPIVVNQMKQVEAFVSSVERALANS